MSEALYEDAKILQEFINKQAEDEGLWFKPVTAPEAYLQQELRKVHHWVEELIKNNSLLSAPATDGIPEEKRLQLKEDLQDIENRASVMASRIKYIIKSLQTNPTDNVG